MNSKLVERVIFMAIGAVLSLAGFMFGTMNTDKTETPEPETSEVKTFPEILEPETSEVKMFDELKVRNLVVYESIMVVKETSDEPIELVVIYHDEGAGILRIVDEEQKRSVNMGVNSEKAFIFLDEKNLGMMALTVNGYESRLMCVSKVTDTIAAIYAQADDSGGLTVYSDKTKAIAGTKILSGGIPLISVGVKDKHGAAGLKMENGWGVVFTESISGRIDTK